MEPKTIFEFSVYDIGDPTIFALSVARLKGTTNTKIIHHLVDAMMPGIEDKKMEVLSLLEIMVSVVESIKQNSPALESLIRKQRIEFIKNKMQ